MDANDALWTRLAVLHSEDAKLNAGSKTLIRSKNPTAYDASRLARSKMAIEDPILKTIRKLEQSIAEDTVRNEYVFHRKIHEWLLNDAKWEDVEALNAKVYAELFLTPKSDPWLGLLNDQVFTALENNGVLR
jgi:hypothetical protein